MVHTHVDAAGLEFFEHLVETFELGFRSLGAGDPTDVVVLLVGGAGVVVVYEAVADERVFDELGYGVDRGGDDRDGPLD